MRFGEELDVLPSQLFGLLLFLVRDVFECVGHTPQVITSLLEHLLSKRMKLLWREHFTCSQHLKVKAEVRGNVAFEGAKRSVRCTAYDSPHSYAYESPASQAFPIL